MDVIEQILATLGRGDRAMVATVISASGSVPVPPGAKMIIHAGGSSGSVGGGALEAHVERTARSWLREGRGSGILQCPLTEDAPESPMLCGGEADVLIEQLLPAHKDCYETTHMRRNAGEQMAILTVLGRDGSVQTKVAADPRNPLDLTALPPVFHGPDSAATVRKAVERLAVVRLPFAEGELLVEPFAGVEDLFIFGGGHVASAVARCAAQVGFRVVVLDDRAEFANAKRFPEAAATFAVSFDEAWDHITVRPSSSVVIVTRGHAYDERVLARALHTPARYIGMIGSRRKVAETFARLEKRGTPATMLERVRAPIGLNIGAITAGEIGISIAAELVAVRRGIEVGTNPMSTPRGGG